MPWPPKPDGSGAPASDPLKIPLCVDLDGTLVRTDTLWESVMILVGRNPLNVLRIAAWASHGRPHLKREIAARVKLNPAALPYNQEFLDYLHRQRDLGRTLLLVTAADRELADRVAQHVGIFEEVLGSDGERNLKGSEKCAALEQRFGPQGFDYAGDSRADLKVWQSSRQAVIVCAGRKVSRQAMATSSVAQTFARPPAGLPTLLRAIHARQWVNSALVFLPILAAHRIFDAAAVRQGVLAMIALSLCMSSGNVADDLLHLASDRAHQRRRHRPFAAGLLSIPFGILLSASLLSASIAIGFVLPAAFRLVLGIYYLGALAYALARQRSPLVDVLVPAGLDTLLVLAGGAAIGVQPPAWLLAIGLLFFLGMALRRRFRA